MGQYYNFDAKLDGIDKSKASVRTAVAAILDEFGPKDKTWIEVVSDNQLTIHVDGYSTIHAEARLEEALNTLAKHCQKGMRIYYDNDDTPIFKGPDKEAIKENMKSYWEHQRDKALSELEKLQSI